MGHTSDRPRQLSAAEGRILDIGLIVTFGSGSGGEPMPGPGGSVGTPFSEGWMGFPTRTRSLLPWLHNDQTSPPSGHAADRARHAGLGPDAGRSMGGWHRLPVRRWGRGALVIVWVPQAAVQPHAGVDCGQVLRQRSIS